MLENVTANLRPRSYWEGQDLGLALARRHIGKLLRNWFCTIVPVWLLLAVLLRNHPVWFTLIVWWLQPACARVPLFYLSRQLFGQETTLREVVRAFPKLFFRGNLHYLTIARFSFWRSFTMPAQVLESSTYVAFRQRAAVLMRHGGGAAFWLTTAGLVFNLFFVASAMSSLTSAFPQWISPFWSQVADFFDYSAPIEMGTLWTLAVLYLVAVTFSENFTVGGGFGLYINSRTHLEGWDIEIAFRGMNARLRGLASCLALGLLLLGAADLQAAQRNTRDTIPKTLPAEVETLSEAATDHYSPKSVAKRVLEHPDFTVHKETYTYTKYDSTTNSNLPAPNLSGLDWIMGFLSNVILSLLIAAVVGGLAYVIYRNRHLFERTSSGDGEIKESAPRVVMGLEIAPEALPSDIRTAAASLWRGGDAHGALRLLYAGSLSWMLERGQLPIRESDTEGDCLRHASGLPDPAQTNYFANLTEQWIATAYGKHSPNPQRMEQLLSAFPF